MSKEKIVEMGNTKVVISEENNIVSVKIESNDAVIYQNGELLWSVGNEKEEFKQIPPIFHSFLIKNGTDYFEYDEKEKTTTFDTTLEKSNLTFYIPNNRNKKITVRYDFIDEERAIDYINNIFDGEEADSLINELKEKISEFKQFIESKGWKYAYSHPVEQWAYAWSDVIFTANQWDENIMSDIAKKIHEFDLYMNTLYDKTN